ncbi:YnbE family lipoprotein [Kangiella sp. TOML190]|uniref:YnbE family lipoprotein n=1 Tax=Kangiella sp. TOML190 TaxID=2931351 RepID=UPI00203BC28D|nr:YnbE family lipoprotein [Kangiella sp. TOML190]
MKKLIPLLSMALFFATACNPTVRIEAPKEPIKIEANIKIQHEIVVRVEKELDKALSEDSGLF